MKRPEKMSVLGLALLRLQNQLHSRTSFFNLWWDDYRCASIIDALISHGFLEEKGGYLKLTPTGIRRLAPEL